jgi:hypothetical protein
MSTSWFSRSIAHVGLHTWCFRHLQLTTRRFDLKKSPLTFLSLVNLGGSFFPLLTMSPCSFMTGICLGALLLITPGDARVGQVSSTSIAGAPLFDSEKFQLTDNDIAKLSQHQSALVKFGCDGTNKTTQPTRKCKVFPGDRQWPSQSAWSAFDDLLGGALIKTVPLAASCYSSWPQYDSDECERISSQWTDSHLQ